MQNVSSSSIKANADSPLLDALRSFASLFVLLHQGRYLFLDTPAHVLSMGVPKIIFYMLCAIGHQSVVVFFVISGYLVGGPALIKLESGRFQFTNYLVDRFSRIFIVLLPALILSFALNAIGAAIFPDAGIADDVIPNWSNFNVLCHVVSLQGLACPSSLDPPLWSLGYEWTLYLAAPLLFSLMLAHANVAFRAVGVGLLVASAVVILPAGAPWDLIFAWFAGVAVKRWNSERSSPPAIALVGAVLALAGVVLGAFGSTPPVADSLLTTVGLVLVFSNRGALHYPFAKSFFHGFASFSYSLYVIHMPVIVIFAKSLQHLGIIDGSRGFNSVNLIAFLASVGLSILIAIVFARFTEANTDVLRKALKQVSFPSRSRNPMSAAVD